MTFDGKQNMAIWNECYCKLEGRGLKATPCREYHKIPTAVKCLSVSCPCILWVIIAKYICLYFGEILPLVQGQVVQSSSQANSRDPQLRLFIESPDMLGKSAAYNIQRSDYIICIAQQYCWCKANDPPPPKKGIKRKLL